MHSKQETNLENMTSYCKQLKNNFFLLLFYIKIVYFVRERIALFIGIYISMKSTFPFKAESSEKMVKKSKFVSKKQNKKLTSNDKNNQKRIRMFWRETIALQFLLLFATTKQYEFTALFYRIISCSKNHKLPSFKRVLSLLTHTRKL